MTGALTVYNDVNVDGNIYVDNVNAGFGASVNGYVTSTSGVEAYGSNQLSLFDRVRFSVSADFRCPVTISGRTTISNSVSAYSVSAYSGYHELGRAIANGQWTDYTVTPAVAGGTLTPITNDTSYMLIGKTLFIQFWQVFTITGIASSTTITFSLPNDPLTGSPYVTSNVSPSVYIGSGYCYDSTVTSPPYITNTPGYSYISVYKNSVSPNVYFPTSTTIQIGGTIILSIP
jgi:hypothetical protein